MNDPELAAMEQIHDAMSPLSAADQKRIARWSMPASNVEVKAQGSVLAALEPLSEPQRVRVGNWAFHPKTGRFSGPASTKTSRPKKAQDRTVDLRAPGAAA